MNSLLSRANAVFAYTLSVLAALTFLCFLSTAFKSKLTPVSVTSSDVVLKKAYMSGNMVNDLAYLTIDFKADFSSLFDWNTKQLFIYIFAEYSTADNPVNQVVLWDKIMLRGEKAEIDYKDLSAKYPFFDDGIGLKGNKNVSLVVSWNLIPDAGMLPLISGGHFSVPFPNEYHQQ
ncbi:signal peptidase complex subunit 3-like [Dysidea avara]|uniref:signal peptidase complex subunit 3-like n=1 Tax=Dysidea avara TaxID=196820 RepID=UPI00332C145F